MHFGNATPHDSSIAGCSIVYTKEVLL